MKITSQLAVAALFFGLMSCSPDADKAETTTASTAPATTVPGAQQATPATTVGLNPEHGQPGHRCDIEVGAPLDAPAKPRLNAPIAPTPGAQTVAPGTNPPHGQPGHDCGIPVGAPLTQK